MASKIRYNDKVIILTGKMKGKCSIVQKILPSGKVILNGINLVKKHCKPIPNMNYPGGILEKESAIDISNIAILNISSGKNDRIGFKLENGKKRRFLKSNNIFI